MKDQRVDMAAVAAAAGVSKATVSRALNNRGRISPATEERVRLVAKQLGYRPNLLASSLRQQRTGTLGVVVSSLVSPFFAQVVYGMESAARRREYSLLLACSEGEPHNERAQVELMLQKGVDGLLVFPTGAANERFYTRLLQENIRLVFVDRHLRGVEVDVVETDNVAGGYLAAQHLIAHGRRRLAFLHVPPPERHNSSNWDRLAGGNRALAEAGLPPARELGAASEEALPEEEFGWSVMEEFLASGGALDALFTASDGLLYGAIRVLEQSGRSVPADVAVIGFDDKPVSRFFHPALTSVWQPMSEMGEEAVGLLVRRLQGPAAAPPQQRLLLAPRLVVRESCGCPPRP